MGRLNVKIVTRPIEVYGEQVDSIETILRPIRLCLNQHHFLCEPVGHGFFRKAAPQVLLSKRHWRKLGIRADRANRHEFLHPELPSVFHHLETHDGIVVKESPGIGAICAYTAHYRGQMDYDLRMGIVVETHNRLAVPQVVFLSTGHDRILASTLA